jgi:hypothetical protein
MARFSSRCLHCEVQRRWRARYRVLLAQSTALARERDRFGPCRLPRRLLLRCRVRRSTSRRGGCAPRCRANAADPFGRRLARLRRCCARGLRRLARDARFRPCDPPLPARCSRTLARLRFPRRGPARGSRRLAGRLFSRLASGLWRACLRSAFCHHQRPFSLTRLLPRRPEASLTVYP